MNSLAHRRTIALYQTLSPAQLAALKAANWRTIEPGREGQHFCHLKLKQRFAEMMARQWELPIHGAGYVARLLLPRAALAGYDLDSVAYEEHLEYCVPVGDLSSLSRELVGQVELVAAFREQHGYSIPPGRQPLASLISWP